MRERFFFGIPLIGRAAARDWRLVEHLLDLTLRTVLAQEHGDFHVLLAGQDVPAPLAALAGDPRFTFIRADWPSDRPTAANDDGGAKKWMIKRRVRDEGGGLLMFLDADDWVPRTLVRRAREEIGADRIGAIVGEGFAVDYRSGRALPFPIAGAFDGAFHELCGSSTIARVVPGATSPLEMDPHAALGSHHDWPAAAGRLRASLVRLEIAGAYLIGTGENHSERDGPFTAWRQGITLVVRERGRPLDDRMAASFGLEPSCLTIAGSRAVSGR